jgi:type II secretory pathway component PulF
MVVTQLSIMLRSGVDLADAVRSISQRSTSKSIGEAMREVYAALESGRSLSHALDAERHRFGGVMVASVAAGEASGRLPEVLARYSVIVRDELRLQSSIRSALGYPLVLIFVTSLVLAAMIFVVLPQFAGIYAASRAPTPAVTQLLLDGAALARTYWWLVLGGLVATVVLAVRQLKSPRGRRRIDYAALRLPFIRTMFASLLSGRMFRLQGVMLCSGVPMLEVLHLTRNSIGNSCYSELIDRIEASVTNGEGVAEVLLDTPCVPIGAAEMISTAESNGQLGEVLQTVGEFYESEGEQLLRDAVKFAEPAIIVALGLVVGAIVLAVMLPLLDLSTAGGA